MDRVYSLRHLGLFSKHLLTVTDKGFYYKEVFYTRDDVKNVRVVKGRGAPRRLGVQLSDGKLILINATALELNGERSKSGFFSGTNEVFDELAKYFGA